MRDMGQLLAWLGANMNKKYKKSDVDKARSKERGRWKRRHRAETSRRREAHRLAISRLNASIANMVRLKVGLLVSQCDAEHWISAKSTAKEILDGIVRMRAILDGDREKRRKLIFFEVPYSWEVGGEIRTPYGVYSLTKAPVSRTKRFQEAISLFDKGSIDTP